MKNNKEVSDKKQCDIHVVSTRSFNELEMLAEDLECVKMWLDDKKAPKTDSNGNEYSVVGRIQCLLNVCCYLSVYPFKNLLKYFW